MSFLLRTLPVLTGLALPALAATRVDLEMDAGGKFQPSGLGTAVPVWNSPAKYELWRDGFQRGGFRLFRFPNGTLSNEYHWNGKGEFDSTGIWTPSPTEVGPGFTVRSRWRGTTKVNYDAQLPSHLTDGDTSTLWWGETFQDSILPWAMLDFSAEVEIDSIEILWGARRPLSWRLESFDGPVYPPPHHGEMKHWKKAAGRKVAGSRSAAGFPGVRSRFFALRGEVAPDGIQIREVRVWHKGVQVSANLPDPLAQTKVLAVSAHPGSVGRSSPWIPEWTFDRFMEWMKGQEGGQALICVNFGTGTPEEAAAWVRYANVERKYGIRRWHVGNEMDGHWEEGGPVDPAQYAVRFEAFVRAMKAVDPGIEVYGPGTYSIEFGTRRSGRDDGLFWLESFLERIGRREKETGIRLLDGVDFHAYPYWFEKGPSSDTALLAAVAKFGSALDLLSSQMREHLPDPSSRMISLSEFNTTVKITASTLEQTNGLAVAMMLQDLWRRFPDRAASILWEPMAGEPMNPDGGAIESYGALRLFTTPRGGLVSGLGDAPTGSWWGQVMVRSWMGAPTTRVIPTGKGDGTLRVGAATDSALWSVLAINPGEAPESLLVRFPSQVADRGEVLLWTPGHYVWSDRTAQAKAVPNLGPTARALGHGESTFVVPARSMMLVRRGKSAARPPRLLHAGWLPGALVPTDTLVLFATVEAEGRRFKKGSWTVGKGKPSALESFDGAWDGSQEGVVARIPASRLPRGRNVPVELRFEVLGNDPLVVTIPVDNEDFPRPVAALDRFEREGLAAENGQGWWTYGHGGNGTRMELSREIGPDGGYLKGVFTIIQPRSQTWPNIAVAGLNVAGTDFSGISRFRGLVFDLRTRHTSATGKFNLQALTTKVKDYDDYQHPLENTDGAWRRVWIRWEDFRQEGWGQGMGPFDPAILRALQFRAAGEGNGEIEIENLCFWATVGDTLELPDPPRRTRGPVRR
ncbi:MAG: CIA30 family protein [Fibrobacteria bacterium]|nr:CIA30 family protein [Fibrobacteria bacterium]